MALTTRLSSTRVEPFYGFVETTGDALRLIQAARQGIVPRITRRLNDLERRAMIRSGAIFIFSDEESGIKRWTEGLSWSASRIVGNFLVYREVSDRSNARSAMEGRRASKRRGNTNELSPSELAEQKLAKALVGCLSDGSGRFKPNGLVKKTITINVDGSDHHLIAYYNQDDVRLGRLLPLSSRPDIMALEIPPELLESTKFRVTPIMQDGPDGRLRYICDAEEGDLPRHISVPFPSMPQAPLTQQSIPHYEPQIQNSTTYPDLPWNAPVLQTVFGPPYRPLVSPSPLSSIQTDFIDNTFEWPDIKAAHGSAYLLRPIGQQFQYASGNQSPQELSNPVSIGTIREVDTVFDYQEYSPSDLLPTRGTYLGAGTKATILAYDPQSYYPHSAFASCDAQIDFQRTAWTQPHFPQHSPSTHSLPATPTQPRCTQRFTSLPSLYESRDFNVSPPLSQARSSPRPMTADATLPQVEPTFLANGLVHFLTA